VSKKSYYKPSAPKVQKPQNNATLKQRSDLTIQESEKWSLMAIESAPYGVLVHDEDGNILIFNTQLEKISGYRKDEIPDIATWIQKVYPDEAYRNLVLKQRESDIPIDRRRVREAIITRKDGEKRICGFSSVLSSVGIRTVYIKDISALRRAEDSLRESEERFRLLTEAAFEGILIHKDGVLLNANDQFFEMFGYQAREVLGRQAIPMVIAPESAPFIKKHIREETSIPYEVTGLKKDGTTFPILIQAKTMEYHDSDVGVAAIRDLSYRRQAESELRNSEERFRALTENLRQVFWLFDWKNQKVEYVSPAYEEVWGRRVEGLYENYAEWAASIYPDDVPYAEETFARIVETGGGEAREYRIVRPDGTVSWISDRGFAIKDKYGDVVRIAGIAEDITERRQALEALAESEEKFRTVTEQSPNMIFINRGGRVVYANRQCEMLMGFSSDEFYSLEFDFMELIAPESRQLIQSNFKRHMQGEEIEPYEYVLINQKGRRIEVIITTRLINYEGERSILGIVTDITERKQAEKALRAKDRAMERQAQSLAEVNTALKVLLEQREKEKADVKEALLANIKKLIFPYIEKLEARRLDDDAQTYVNIVKSNLNDLIAPLANSLYSKYFELTPSEIQIADLIKAGKTSKDIASMLNVSPKAISFHRGNLRKKLGLANKKINLRTYLQSFPQ
jgi:PAS domain S-box-containing protein